MNAMTEASIGHLEPSSGHLTNRYGHLGNEDQLDMFAEAA